MCEMCKGYHNGCECGDCLARDAYNEHVSPEQQLKQRRDGFISFTTHYQRLTVQKVNVPTGTHAKWLVNWFIKRALQIRGLSPIDSN